MLFDWTNVSCGALPIVSSMWLFERVLNVIYSENNQIKYRK